MICLKVILISDKSQKKLSDIKNKAYLCGVWEIDLTYREKLDETFKRLLQKRDLLNNSRPLPNIALQKIKENLAIEWTYNSNSIEGNSITLRETHLILQEGMTVKGKPLREHFEVNNHHKALTYLYKIVTSDYTINTRNTWLYFK